MHEAVDNLQGLHSNQKLLRSGNVKDYYHCIYGYYKQHQYSSSAYDREGLHPEPIGSTNNRNRVRSSRAPSGGAGFNSPRRAAPL
jgi:hypothetical protein